ncbi:related to MKC7-aspartyl protease of the periplasmic space [Sporisorium scitamineum]|uniref:Related to MKC7-aspartyl protease of the periplasmic space n=1 Tax=Sporisorium scitamineum TaxID=49012 RepID=A0A0F7RVL2_9BASI|nr:hypothetical protein [Sporisorium scitamineum]CDU25731.1 related to MKC7-aspartyl protease of the periplasmic space [Sporisorium scitamineum]
MAIQLRRTGALVWLLFVSIHAKLSIASPSDPPSFFHEPPGKAHNPAVLPLRAPSHLLNNVQDHASLQRHLQQAATARKRTLFPRQDAQLSNDQPSTSSANDKLQSIGFLSGAYDVPLNLSSNPPQLVFVQLDTGSSDLWITSSNCTTPQCQNNRVLKFDPSKSTSFEAIHVDAGARLNLTASSFGGDSTNAASVAQDGFARRQSDNGKAEVAFSIFYDDTTSASGVVVADKIGISDLSVAKQAFALINATNVTLGEQGISGVLGLGFPRGSVVSRSLLGYQDQIGSQVKTLPLMTSLLQTSGESYPLFGLYLTRTGGRATFGAVDPYILPTTQDRSLVEWYDVYPFPSGDTALPPNDTLNIDAQALGPYVQWVLPLTAAGVGGVPATLTPMYRQVSQTLALIDSGSSSMIGPPGDVESIFAKIRNSRHVGGGRFVVPCDTTDRMYFSFGGVNLTLLPTDYIIGPDAQQPYLCFAWPAAAQPDATGVSWILGTPFLRAVYTLFSIGINNKEPPKIGFYPLRQPANASQSSIVFAPQPTAQLSSFLAAQATTINSVLPNSLVSLTPASSVPYFFANATVTPRLGWAPTRVGAPSTYGAMLGAGRASEVPVIASSSRPLPVPSNPATGAGGVGNGAASGGVWMWMGALLIGVVLAMVGV